MLLGHKLKVEEVKKDWGFFQLIFSFQVKRILKEFYINIYSEYKLLYAYSF